MVILCFPKQCVSSARSAVFHHGKAVYIINSVGVVSHQAAGKCTPHGVMICKGGKPPLMIYTPYGVMICQACGLDKKIPFRGTGFFGRGAKTRTLDMQFWRLPFYQLNYTPVQLDYYNTTFLTLQVFFLFFPCFLIIKPFYSVISSFNGILKHKTPLIFSLRTLLQVSF